MPGHPRPQLRRLPWTSLDGTWRFSFDDEGRFRRPADIAAWPLEIRVPFAPESQASGLDDRSFHRVCWYQRDLELERPAAGGCVRLHFGAVDYTARVWVNDRYLGEHQGGHVSFSFDITDALAEGGVQQVTVRAEDDPHDLAKPRGKQDWQRQPHGIWYPRTTGIWQTVWLEILPPAWIERIRWTPLLERWEIGLETSIGGLPAEVGAALELKVCLSAGDQLLARDSYQVIHGEVNRRIALSDPGIDDFRNELLWCPEKPTLIQAALELWGAEGRIDRVESYTALRSITTQRGDFLLNGRPYYLRMVLDQGYWPDSLMTAPSDEALRRDVELIKALGFNGARLHQKIESPRFLYWADVLGLLLWEEMPSAYRFTYDSVERIAREWMQVIARDWSHPSIAVWVPFNESWGVPDLAEKATHRSCVQALYHLTKTFDPTRLVIGNDGWESTATDIVGIHDYDNHPGRLRERYGADIAITELLSRRSPAGRIIQFEGYPRFDQPIVLSEFGGFAYVEAGDPDTAKSWGYGACRTREELRQKLADLVGAVRELPTFRGFCYTQLTDVFQEANGLLFADRRPKLPLEEIAAIMRGDQPSWIESTDRVLAPASE
jgi:beta-galactosidase/beta-glucuronidase